MVRGLYLLTAVMSMAQFALCQHIIAESNRSASTNEASSIKWVYSKEEPTLRIQEADLIKLDSIVEYDYNANTGQCDKKSTKTAYRYDHNLNVVLFIKSEWSDLENDWFDIRTERTTYDLDGNKKEWIARNRNSSNQWIPFQKEIYLYNTNNLIGEVIAYNWTDVLNDWEPASKTIFDYDSQNKKTSATYYEYSFAQVWSPMELEEFFYNENHLDWINGYIWDIETGEWAIANHENLIYDLYQILYSISHERWIEESQRWKRYGYEGFVRDDNGDLQNHTIATFKEEREIFKENYEFDFSIHRDVLVLPQQSFADDLAFHHMIKTKTLSLHDVETMEFMPQSEMKYFYSPMEIITEIIDVNPVRVKLYPNPVERNIQFHLPDDVIQAKLELRDMHHKTVMSCAITNDEGLDLSNLESGIYIYTLNFGKEKICGKLIKK